MKKKRKNVGRPRVFESHANYTAVSLLCAELGFNTHTPNCYNTLYVQLFFKKKKGSGTSPHTRCNKDHRVKKTPATISKPIFFYFVLVFHVLLDHPVSFRG